MRLSPFGGGVRRRSKCRQGLSYLALLPLAYFCVVGVVVTFGGRGMPSDTDVSRPSQGVPYNTAHLSRRETPGLGVDNVDPPVIDVPKLDEHDAMAEAFRVKENRLRQEREAADNEGPGNNMNVLDMIKPRSRDSKRRHQDIHTEKKAQDNPQGPGSEGRAVDIVKENLSQSDRKKFDDGWQRNAFNQYASDLISLHRSLPDVRDEECKSLMYAHDLPDTSVVVIFHNEAWSVLLRTVHSIIDRSPPHLLNEVILVDDFSDFDHLKEPLEQYVARNVTKVKVVRAKKREGLIRARLLGAAVAKGAVITFLDSHCECTQGWLEPILARIKENASNVVTPVIDVIDDATLRYQFGSAKATSVGGFDWNMQFNWHGIPDAERKRRRSPVEPIRSPTMAGGLFSIDKKYFEYLGTYDPGMDIWGGENLELSFRIWMCGGQLEIVPCSHVGHIFRKRSPYSWKTGVNVVKKNSVRVAEVWMDHYKNYYYERLNYDLGDYGDVTARKELRVKLHCKSFQWYIDNVFPELFIPGEAIASGDIANKLPKPNGQFMCLDSPVDSKAMQKAIKMWPCHKQGGNQYWMLSKEGEIRRDEGCLDYAGQFVMVYQCHGMKGNQEWVYGEDNTLRHKNTNLCMELQDDREKLDMKPCTGIDRQIWVFKRRVPDSEKTKAAA